MTFQTFPINEIYQIPNIQIVLSFTKKKKESGRIYNYNALTIVVNCNFGTRPT